MHDHARDHRDPAPLRALRIALVSTGILLVLETAGGFASGSLALLADAAHLLTDVFGLGLAYTAALLAGHPATPRRTYGLYRVEILATLANGILLLGLAVFILIEAVARVRNPEPVKAGWMLGVAAVGLLGNLVALGALRHPKETSLNVKAAYFEVLADAIGAAGVLVAALVILPTGWIVIDPVLSALLAVAMVPRTIKLLREVLHILLEGTPPGLDHADVEAELRALPGVAAVHDLHVWLLTSGMPVLTAHVVVEEGAPCDDLLERIADRLRDAFAIDHTTIQIEHVDRARREEARF